MRTHSWRAVVAAGSAAALLIGAMPSSAASAVASKAEVLVATLDAAGNVVGVTSRSVSAKEDGSRDHGEQVLQLADGLVETTAGRRALPLVLQAAYTVDGVATPADQVAAKLRGRSARVEAAYTVTNRSLKAEDVSTTDSVTGEQSKRTLVTAIPFQVALAGVTLPDGAAKDLTSDGLIGRSADGSASTLSWSSVLAPPLYPGTAVFHWAATLTDAAPPAATLTARAGLPDALPASIASSIAKGGATTATVQGAVTQFGAGFTAVTDGTAQLNAGVNALVDGLNSTGFDKAAFADDPTVASNQPGLLEALNLLADGTKKLKGGVGLVRQGLSTGDLAGNPGAVEALQLLQAGIGHGAGTAADRAAGKLFAEWDCSSPLDGKADDPLHGGPGGTPCGVAQGATGAAKPVSLMAALDTFKAVFGSLASGATQVHDGLGKAVDGAKQVRSGLGKVDAGAAQIKGGLDQALAPTGVPALASGLGSPADTKSVTVPSIGTGTSGTQTAIVPGSLAAAIASVRGAAGNGAGSEWDCTGDGVGDNPVSGGPGGGACGITQALAGAAAPLSSFATLQLFQAIAGSSSTALSTQLIPTLTGLGVPAPLLAGLQQVLTAVGTIAGGIGTSDQFDCLPYDPAAGRAHTSDVPGRATAQQCNASTPGAKPVTLLSGIGQLYGSLGDGTEIVGGSPLTVQATITALKAGVTSLLSGLGQASAGIGTGASGEYGPDGTPLTLVAALKALEAGVGLGGELGPDGLPSTLTAALQALKAGVGTATDPASIVGALTALQAGLGNQDQFTCKATPATCTSTSAGASPGSTESGLAQVRDTLGVLQSGLTSAAAGLGSLSSYDAAGNGTAGKAGQVTRRVARTGTVVEDPATVLYGLQGIQDSLAKVIAGVGERGPSGETVLAGLTQVADGLRQVGVGTKAGAAGASTLGSIVEKSMIGADAASAATQRGSARASRYGAFSGAPPGIPSTTVFVLQLPAAG